MFDNNEGERFELPVEYRGREELLPARMVRMGYTYKIFVQAGAMEIIFEPDEERNFRAVVEDTRWQDKVDIELIRAIGEALEKSFR